MKPVFSEEYYRTHWDKFLKRVPGNDYINLEGELAKVMKSYKEAGMPMEAMQVVEKIEAEKLSVRCKELVMKEMEVVKRINAGKASFGMTTQRQEIEQRGNYIRRFEFNCLQLADFRKNHKLA